MRGGRERALLGLYLGCLDCSLEVDLDRGKDVYV